MENQEKLIQFVQWLGENIPELKGKAPEQIVETVNKLSASKEGQQMLQGLIKEFESSTTGMFKKGGKLDYLLCLQKGGNIQDCGCGKKIKKAEDGIVLGSEQYPHASRRDMFNSAQEQLGWDRNKTREAYRLQKEALRDKGYSGRELRQRARYKIIDRAYPRAENPVATTTNPEIKLPSILEPTQTPVTLNLDTPDWTKPQLPQYYDVVEEPVVEEALPQTQYFQGEFGDCFNRARQAGLKEFIWDDPRAKYRSYHTGIKTDKNGESQSAVEQTANSGALNSPTVTGVLPDYVYDPLYEIGVNLRKKREAKKAAKK